MHSRRRQPQDQPRARVRSSAPPQGRSEVFSYHANRSIREGGNNVGRTVPDAAPRHTRSVMWVKRLPMVVALIVIIACCFDVLNLNNNPKVVAVASNTASIHLFLQNTDIYQKAAQKLFANSVLNDNKVTVDTASITASLQEQFPELQNVSVALPLIGHRPIVYLQPANPVIFLTTQGGGVYILDKSGRALVGGGVASSQLTQLHLPAVHDNSGIQVQVGEVALPSDDVDFIAQVAGQLQAKGLAIASLELPARASELDVRFKSPGYEVRFNMQGNARQQAGAFLATQQYLTAQHVTPGQYIDVRVPERAYYK